MEELGAGLFALVQLIFLGGGGVGEEGWWGGWGTQMCALWKSEFPPVILEVFSADHRTHKQKPDLCHAFDHLTPWRRSFHLSPAFKSRSRVRWRASLVCSHFVECRILTFFFQEGSNGDFSSVRYPFSGVCHSGKPTWLDWDQLPEGFSKLGGPTNSESNP